MFLQYLLTALAWPACHGRVRLVKSSRKGNLHTDAAMLGADNTRIRCCSNGSSSSGNDTSFLDLQSHCGSQLQCQESRL